MTTQPTPQPDSPSAIETLEQLDPRTLLRDRNITAREADPTLIESVRDLGVVSPVRAVRTADGAVRLRYGHRRTAAAIAVGLPTIQVIVAQANGEASDPEAAAQAVERLVEQWAENEHRAGLGPTARIEAMAQMSLLGVSHDQIAARTHVPRDHVTAALKVATSTAARRVLEEAPSLDLGHVAVIAEFDDDPDAVDRLTGAALLAPGRFAHVVAKERDTRARSHARAAAEATLTERGIWLITVPTWDQDAAALTRLRHDGAPITPAQHATCPGRAAYLEEAWTTAVHPSGADLSAADEEHPDQTSPRPADLDYPATAEHQHTDLDNDDLDDDQDAEDDGDDDSGWAPSRPIWRMYWACAHPTAHGHTNPSKTTHATSTTRSQTQDADADPEQAREAQRAERRRVRENNSAWRLAEGVRRDFIRTLLARRTAPKGSAAFTATIAAVHPHALTHHNAPEMMGDLLGAASPGRGYGASPTARTALVTASEARAQVIALGVAIAACEAASDVNDWRRPCSTTAAMLQALTTWGYERSDVERLACGEQGEQDNPTEAANTDDDPDDKPSGNQHGEDTHPIA